jgi:putative endonuclease
MEQFKEITLSPDSGVCCVYILQCRDGSLYTGWTNHLQERLKAHNSGRGAKYTKGRGPVRCVYVETFASKEEAMSREFAVKHLTRAEKETLILGALRDSHIKG